jgi:CCR4-NOT transcription complex subunit 6
MDKFTALSYNILCQRYATKSQYGYAPSRVLDWDYRKEIILGEIQAQDADIVCLQELDKYNYDEFFRVKLAEGGYKGYYAQKGRAETVPHDQAKMVDGCGTFFKQEKYIQLEAQYLNFGRKAIEKAGPKVSADLINRVWQRDDIATILLLENRATGSRIVVVNAHFYWDPAYKDVKLIQVAVLMDELARLSEKYAKREPCSNESKKIFKFSDTEEGGNSTPEPGPSQEYSTGTQIPMIICGDFNSGTDSTVYDLLSSGKLGSKHADLEDRDYGIFSNAGISHPFTLKSAYSSVGELSFTNYTPGFVDVIDYIWYSANSLRVSGVLGDVDKEYLQRVPGFPNFHFPSDHLALMAEFVVSGKKQLKVTEADFGSVSGSGSQRDRK